MSRQNAGNQIQRTAADLASFSNRLADAEMKLNHQERMNLRSAAICRIARTS
jgi:hypothetical protein